MPSEMQVVEQVDEFFEAINNSDANKVKEIISGAGSKYINTPNKDGEFGLHAAAKKRALNIMAVLLDAGASVNQGSDEVGTYKGYTAAHYAARNDDTDALLLLAKHKCDLNRQAADGWAPLHAAAFGGKGSAIKTLLDKKVDVNVKNTHQISPLVFAVNHGRVNHVRSLLQAGSSTDIIDTNGDGLFHHCFHYQMQKMFEGDYDMPEVQFDVGVTLAIYGVDPELKNTEGNYGAFYLDDDVPSMMKVLKILKHHSQKFLSSQTDWNYMTLVSAAKPEHFLGMGLEMAHGMELYTYLQNLEKERLAEKAEREASRPAGGCPVMKGGKKKKKGAAGAKTEAPPDPNGPDPSNGACPFFKKKDGAAATTEAPPAGHPPVEGGDVSKCPFGGKAPAEESTPSPVAAAAPAKQVAQPVVAAKAPGSFFELVYENRQTAMLLVIAFFCGIWFEQFAASFRGASVRQF